MIRRTPRSTPPYTLSPYTTLFRSRRVFDTNAGQPGKRGRGPGRSPARYPGRHGKRTRAFRGQLLDSVQERLVALVDGQGQRTGNGMIHAVIVVYATRFLRCPRAVRENTIGRASCRERVCQYV